MPREPQPKWYSQLNWSPPHKIGVVLPLSTIPDDPGLYAYSRDPRPLSKQNCLYIGKADGMKHTLRDRLAVYLRAFTKAELPPATHAGEYMLHKHYRQTPPLFLRWTIVAIARELEGSLIDMFDPCCNFDFPEPRWSDRESIPDDYLPRNKKRWWPRPGGLPE